MFAAGVEQGRDTAEVATLEPIACWWRTGAGAVRVGERFSLVLTCAVVETAATTVVPDQSKLDPAVLQLPPFDVVSGTQATETRTPTHRLVQYEYNLRYVGESFGTDVALPPLTITYRVQSRVASDNTASESRDRQYTLPAVTVRILSLVPAAARDIRDQPAATLRQIDARRFQARVMRIFAGLFYVVGGIVVVSGMTRAFRRRPGRVPAATGLVSDLAVLRQVSAEMDEVRRLRGVEGWTDALAARALAALRLVAGCLLSRRPSQLRDQHAAIDGQLLVRQPWPGRRTMLVSSAVTSRTLADATGAAGSAGAPYTGHLEELDDAMRRLAAAAYGRNGSSVSDAALDDAFDVGVRALARARGERTRRARARRAVASSLGRLQVWAGNRA